MPQHPDQASLFADPPNRPAKKNDDVFMFSDMFWVVPWPPLRFGLCAEFVHPGVKQMSPPAINSPPAVACPRPVAGRPYDRSQGSGPRSLI